MKDFFYLLNMDEETFFQLRRILEKVLHEKKGREYCIDYSIESKERL